jgi:hypothetical protein
MVSYLHPTVDACDGSNLNNFVIDFTGIYLYISCHDEYIQYIYIQCSTGVISI